MLVTEMAKTVANILFLSPIHSKPNIRHQDRCKQFNQLIVMFFSETNSRNWDGKQERKTSWKFVPSEETVRISEVFNFLVIFISSWKAGADKMTKKINTLSGLLNPSSRRTVFLEHISYLMMVKAI